MERSKQRAYDYALVIVLGIIIVTGLVILYSTSAYNGELKFQDSFYYLKKQIFATLLGIAGMWIIARVDYHVWKKWSVPGYLVSVLLGIAVLLIGDEYNGSKRWLSLGPFSFQPSEFAKVAVILFLTYVIMRNVKSMGKFTTVCKIVISVLPVVGLVGASNLSTAIIILGIAVVLVFVASPKYGQFAWMIFLGCAFMGIFTPTGLTTPYTYLYKTMSGNTMEVINEHMPLDLRSNKDFVAFFLMFVVVLTFIDIKIDLKHLCYYLGILY